MVQDRNREVISRVSEREVVRLMGSKTEMDALIF